MSPSQFLYLYLLTVPVFLILDGLWLGVVATKFYQTHIGHLLGPVNWSAAIVFYLIYIAGILLFATAPALSAGSLSKALFLGAALGIIAYATYDLTNLATLKDWPLVVVIADVIWGAVLTGTVAAVSYLIGKSLFL